MAIVGDIKAFIGHLPETERLSPSYRALQLPLKKLVTAAPGLGISKKRAQNIVSSVKMALRWQLTGTIRRNNVLSSEWQTLKNSLGARSFERASLSSFMGWCSLESIAPTNVDSEVLARFHSVLLTERSPSEARRRVNAITYFWNMLVDSVQVWPKTKVAKPPRIAKGTTTDQFAPAFIEDLARYAESITKKKSSGASDGHYDPDDDEATSSEPRRASTARSRVYTLRRAAVRLAEARDIKLTDITSLRQLLVHPAPKEILEETHEDLGAGYSVLLTIAALIDVAESYVKHAPITERDRKRLSNLQRQSVKPERTMTEKNRRLLRSLSPSDFAALYAMPDILCREVNRRINSRRPLRDFELRYARSAVALSFLLWTPPRIANVAMVRIDRHLYLPDSRGGAARLEFTAKEMKGKKAWSVPLHERTLPIVQWYLAHVRPLMGGEPDILFPGEQGTVDTSTLRRDINHSLTAFCRVQPNPHFFRHLVAHCILVQDPGNYEAVSKLLAHKDVETTKEFYSGEETEAAIKHVGRCLTEAADQFSQSEKFRRRPNYTRRTKG